MSHPTDWPDIYRHYCHNLCRHLNDVARTFEQRLMRLMAHRGYHHLRPTWVQVMPYIHAEGTRIVDLAREQGISKQAVGQLVSEIESLGYLQRAADRHDQRSRRVVLSPRGLALLAEAAEASSLVEQEFAAIVGPAAWQALDRDLATLFHGLQLQYPAAGGLRTGQASRLAMRLHSLAAVCEQRLMAAGLARGHRALKRSFGLVLPFLGESGTRIIDIARIQGVSKQAISQIAQTIERAGYLAREEDPTDRRSRRLVFTPRGKLLIRDAVLAMQALEQELAALIGETRLQALADTLAALHAQLGIPGPDMQVTGRDGERQLLEAWLAALAALPQGRNCFSVHAQGWQLSADTLQQLASLRLDPAAGDAAQVRKWLRAAEKYLPE